MTRLLIALITLAQFGCKDTQQKIDNVKIAKGDTASIENIIHQVKQQTLLYLDTMIGNNCKRLVQFHSKLDSSTDQTLKNWILHNKDKVQPGDKEVLNLLTKSHVDSLLLIKQDTTLITNTSNGEKVTQIHFNSFSFNSDTTKVATIVGVYFGDEGERISGWKEFLIFNRQGSNFTITNRGIVIEY